MKELNLYLARYIYNEDESSGKSVIGDLYLDKMDDEPFCYTLEDQVRAKGVKVHGETAIPAGTYDITIRYSPRFKRDTAWLHNDVDDKGVLYVNGEGDKDFYYVLIHGGNEPKNTEGCILVAYNTDGKRIWGTAEKELTKKIKEYDKVTITIEDRFLTYHGKHQA